ncbi:hypothetical protein BD289DRAFT_432926 [Coniella lustricola]|uniref:Secreted protein n=1 Tax=Coniella lustricola TaxID=2025994 RepID=A0A2T3A9A1_9PEZI|nr:hypothetical protein BD289DRAFT_432926 [Coniella lustricola]
MLVGILTGFHFLISFAFPTPCRVVTKRNNGMLLDNWRMNPPSSFVFFFSSCTVAYSANPYCYATKYKKPKRHSTAKKHKSEWESACKHGSLADPATPFPTSVTPLPRHPW